VSGVNGKLRRVGDAYNRGHYIENQRNWAKGMNSWDWAGGADATLGIVGGGLEITAGVLGEALTGGLSTVAIVDGVGRVGLNTFRLSAYVAGKSGVGKALPSNIGGMAGKIFDGAVLKKGFYESGPAQGVLGTTNDAAAFVIGGGTNMHLLLFPAQVGLKSWSFAVSSNSLFLYDTFKPLLTK